jgi:hypothetical protein
VYEERDFQYRVILREPFSYHTEQHPVRQFCAHFDPVVDADWLLGKDAFLEKLSDRESERERERLRNKMAEILIRCVCDITGKGKNISEEP